MPDPVELMTFVDLQDHELTLWGVVCQHRGWSATLVVRGNALGYVEVARPAKRAAEVRIAIRLRREEDSPFGDGAMREFEATVVRGVRKCLWGERSWPKHTVDFSYRVEVFEHEPPEAAES